MHLQRIDVKNGIVIVYHDNRSTYEDAGRVLKRWLLQKDPQSLDTNLIKQIEKEFRT
jgi:hypothetical protein